MKLIKSNLKFKNSSDNKHLNGMTNSSSKAPNEIKSQASTQTRSSIDDFIVELSDENELFDSGTQPRSLAALAERDRQREQLYLQQQAKQKEHQTTVTPVDRKHTQTKPNVGNRSQSKTNASDISPVMIVNEKVTNNTNIAEHRTQLIENNAVNKTNNKLNQTKLAVADTEVTLNKTILNKKSVSDSNNKKEMEKSTKNSTIPVLSAVDRTEKKNKSGFLSRFTGFRFSLRGNKKKLKSMDNVSGHNSEQNSPSNNIVYVSKSATIDGSGQLPFVRSRPTDNGRGPSYQRSSMRSNEFVYIPLKDPKNAFNDDTQLNNVTTKQFPSNNNNNNKHNKQVEGKKATSPTNEEKTKHVLTGKPPLPRQPPRVVGVCAKQTPVNNNATKSSTLEQQRHAHQQRSSSAPREIHPSDIKNFHSTKRNNDYDIDDEVDFYQNQLRSGIRLNQTIGGGMTSAISTDGMLGDSTFIDNEEEEDDDGKIGLIETNLDTDETIISGKTRSLMELGPQQLSCHRISGGVARRLGNRGNANGGVNSVEPRRPHKSMEFLLDKENQRFVLVSTEIKKKMLFFFI